MNFLGLMFVDVIPVLMHFYASVRENLYFRCKHVGVADTLWPCISNVQGSNLDRVTGYPDRGFSLFSSLSPTECRPSVIL